MKLLCHTPSSVFITGSTKLVTAPCKVARLFKTKHVFDFVLKEQCETKTMRNKDYITLSTDMQI